MYRDNGRWNVSSVKDGLTTYLEVEMSEYDYNGHRTLINWYDECQDRLDSIAETFNHKKSTLR